MSSPSPKCTVSICCCGCTLRQGTLIIGWLALIGSVLVCASNAVVAVRYSDGTLWGAFAISVLDIPLALCLIVGANTNRPILLWTWVYVSSILLLLDVILTIIVITATKLYSLLISVAIGCALQIYFIVVIRSHALEIESGVAPGTAVVVATTVEAGPYQGYQATGYQPPPAYGYQGSNAATGYADATVKP